MQITRNDKFQLTALTDLFSVVTTN